MNDISCSARAGTAACYLHLTADERPVLAVALRLLLGDMAHTSLLRQSARHALERVGADPALVPATAVTLALDAAELEVVHTALHLLYEDVGGEDARERGLIRGLLDRLPGGRAPTSAMPRKPVRARGG